MHLTDRSGIKKDYKSAHYIHNLSFFFFFLFCTLLVQNKHGSTLKSSNLGCEKKKSTSDV